MYIIQANGSRMRGLELLRELVGGSRHDSGNAGPLIAETYI